MEFKYGKRKKIPKFNKGYPKVGGDPYCLIRNKKVKK